MGTFGVVAMNAARLRRIVANLLRYVPDPPKPEARPTASFAGLKVGQRIEPSPGVPMMLEGSKEGLTAHEVMALTSHEPWEVIATDSQGATVRCNGVKKRIEDRNWKAAWSRVRAHRKPRKEKTL
jgi:hypothetical protein